MSIPNRFDIVQAVDAAHPALIHQNTRETCTEFLWRTVDQLSRVDARFGFLSKSAGENGVDIPGVGRVSIDAIAYKDEEPIVDIMHSAGDGPGTGGISWGENPERRPSNEWVQAIPYPDAPPPNGGTPPPADLYTVAAASPFAFQECLRWLQSLEARVQALEQGGTSPAPALGKVALKTAHGRYVAFEDEGSGFKVIGDRTEIGGWEQVELVRVP